MDIITNRYKRETGKSPCKFNWFNKRIHNQDYIDWLEKQVTNNKLQNKINLLETIVKNGLNEKDLDNDCT